VLQREQESEIHQLEHQLEEERFAHEEKIRSIKTQFLKEKRMLEEVSEAKIREMTAHANKVINACEILLHQESLMTWVFDTS
jgi:hypothetical protein